MPEDKSRTKGIIITVILAGGIAALAFIAAFFKDWGV